MNISRPVSSGIGMEAIRIRDFLFDHVTYNPYIESIQIYFPDSRIMLSNHGIKYLGTSYWKDEFSDWLPLASLTQEIDRKWVFNNRNHIGNDSNKSVITHVRTLPLGVIGEKVKAFLLFNISQEVIEKKLESAVSVNSRFWITDSRNSIIFKGGENKGGNYIFSSREMQHRKWTITAAASISIPGGFRVLMLLPPVLVCFYGFFAAKQKQKKHNAALNATFNVSRKRIYPPDAKINFPVKIPEEIFGKLTALEHHIKEGSKVKCQKTVDDIYESVHWKIKDAETVKETASYIILRLNELALELGLCRESTPISLEGNGPELIHGIHQYTKKICFQLISSNIERRKNIKNTLLKEIMSYTKENLNTVSLESLSYHFTLSKSAVSKLFKNELGISYLEYLKNLKLETAKEFLESRGMPIERLSAALGYSSAKYFTKLFKGMYGITPREYRYSRIT
jgi:AraC-like DNA-binding protein